MTFAGNLAEALAALHRNAVRSALTAVGVAIGVAGIIVLGAAAGGASAKIQTQVEAIGADTLIARAVEIESTGERRSVVLLTDEDAQAIRDRVPGIRFVSRKVLGNITTVAGHDSWTTAYWGVDASFADVFDVRIAEGRFFDDREVRTGARVVVLGATVATNLLGEQALVGRTIRMGAVPVRVIGVRTKLGFVGGQDYDNFVIVPVTTARARFPKPEKAVARVLDQIDMKVFPGADRAAAKEAILALLLERNRLGKAEQDKFNVFDSTSYVELMNTTHSTLSWLLAATAVISLVVGGVGIMNIMLVSVTERTREIGLRMAIGASRGEILAQFLTEAIVLCVAAGLAGLGLGIAGGYIVAQVSGWPLVVGPLTVALALAASAGVGMAFGYVPARRAAMLDPIDALRYE